MAEHIGVGRTAAVRIIHVLAPFALLDREHHWRCALRVGSCVRPKSLTSGAESHLAAQRMRWTPPTRAASDVPDWRCIRHQSKRGGVRDEGYYRGVGRGKAGVLGARGG